MARSNRVYPHLSNIRDNDIKQSIHRTIDKGYDLQELIEALTTRVAALESSVSTLQSEVDTLQAQMTQALVAAGEQG